MRLVALTIIALLSAVPAHAQVRPSLAEGVMSLSLQGVGATHIIPFEANRRPGKELLFLDLRQTPVRSFIGVYEPTQTKPWPATYAGPICLEPWVELQAASSDVWQSFAIDDLTGDGLDDVLVYSSDEQGEIQAGRLTIGKGLQHCR